ncbi:hypothetical protein BLA29_015165 [Euroglyphus maynei]|uniref:Uncharacterized protein n=1 Tax=Euroglyphus maynei TaxID=6958 RepID=A0A1Y3BS37_EURMA|nr:hypothetical protein BLA29_015165 [Euroglyphus maynei]
MASSTITIVGRRCSTYFNTISKQSTK